jgi:hypothetical protein
MKLLLILMLVTLFVKAETRDPSAETIDSEDNDDDELFPLSIIHLNDFHAR